MRILVDTIVAAPREKVFALVMDLERWPERIPEIVSVEVLTEGPVGVGTRFAETRWMLGRKAREEMTFAEIVPATRIVLTAESGGTRYLSVHTFEAVEGGTRARIVFEGVPVTFAARLLTPLAVLMRGHIRNALASDLAALKRAAELDER